MSLLQNSLRLRSDIIIKLELIQSLYFYVFLYCRHNNMLHLSLSVFLGFSHCYWLDLQGFFFHFGIIWCWSLTDRSHHISFRTHIDHAAEREREREKKAALWGRHPHCRNHDKHMTTCVTQTSQHWSRGIFTLDHILDQLICAEVIFWTQILLENSSLVLL